MAGSGLKTREFDDILSEIRQTFEVHAALGSRLGGVHFELTGENVTECTGGPEQLLEHDLPRRYTTYCDPRLNYAQSMEVSFLIAQYLQTQGDGRKAGAAAAAAGDADAAAAAAAAEPPRFAAGRGFSPMKA